MIEKILIIDDNEGDQVLIKEALAGEDSSREFVVASSGEDAITKFEEFNPEAVIIDTLLPGMDGFEICKSIKSINADAKVIMITGQIEAIDEVRAKDAGVDQYTVKGEKYSALIEAFNKF